MKLGAFSVSLSVKDINASLNFYQNLGFSIFHGDPKQNWVILKNEQTVIGLFQGMFPKNVMTFNPGWDQDAQNTDEFDDIRVIQRLLQEREITLDSETDANSSGPAHIMLTDPDGNQILIDQHR